MLEFLLAGPNVPFAAAIVLMLAIAFFEGVAAVFGLGLGSVLDALIPDFELNAHAEIADVGSQSALSRLLGWLRVGKVPVLMLLVVYLLAFGATGLTLNFITVGALGVLLPAPLTVSVAFLAALPATRLGASILEAIMPKDESNSVSLDSLIGREAIITLGECSRDNPAEARVRDQYGTSHYVMVVPDEGHGPFNAHTPLLLVRRQGDRYVAIASQPSTN